MSEDRKAKLRKLALDTASDAASDFAYYGRKEDEEFSREDLEEAIAIGAVTLDEIAAAFRAKIGRGLE